MNGAQRRVAVLAAAGFTLLVTVVVIANAESTISDLEAAGIGVPHHLVWSWEWTSLVAWLSLAPMIWWTAGRIMLPHRHWPTVALLTVFGGVAASAWHIALMVALRHLYYFVCGAGPYTFFGSLDDPIMYEFRKDLVSLIQFLAIAGGVRWAIARHADEPLVKAEASPETLLVVNGAARFLVPLVEIERVTAAGNYVEVEWAGRTLLHRATMFTTQLALGDAFMRVHRCCLVRADAIRNVMVERSGDFTIELGSGARVRGSRRYRTKLEEWERSHSRNWRAA